MSVRGAVWVLCFGWFLHPALTPRCAADVLPPGTIVVNGGFEGRFAGWHGTFGYLDSISIGRPVPALEGKITGVVVDVGSSSVGQPMWQTLTTIPGARYTLRFSLLSGYGLVGEQSRGNTGSPVNVYWGGELLGVGGQFLGTFRNTSTTNWLTWNFEVTATSSSTMIQFVDWNDMRWQLIDAVSVVQVVPEPGVARIILLGLVALPLGKSSGVARLRATSLREPNN